MDFKKLTEKGRLRHSAASFAKSAEGKSSNRSKDENVDSFQVIEKMDREMGKWLFHRRVALIVHSVTLRERS